MLVTDAFGGHGGIAKFNRDLLTVLSSQADCEEILVIPRLMADPSGPLPANLTYVTAGLHSKLRYATTVLKSVLRCPKFDLLICGHINLLPIAFLARVACDAPIALVIHGIDAWRPTRRLLTNYCVRKIQAFIAVSKLTKERFLEWTGLGEGKGFILPNCVDITRFGPGRKNPALLERYGLKNNTVIMTLGRLDSKERHKGFDEVLELLPELAKKIPNIAYLIAGDGYDRPRLEKKAARLKVRDRVVFAGRISEDEKADHYRLADAYVMPSRGEGFGIVFLEAMACGIPVVASKTDGSREAVQNGKLGILVNPQNPKEIRAGILKALMRPRGLIPEGLEYFSYENFQQRCGPIVSRIVKNQ